MLIPEDEKRSEQGSAGDQQVSTGAVDYTKDDFPRTAMVLDRVER